MQRCADQASTASTRSSSGARDAKGSKIWRTTNTPRATIATAVTHGDHGGSGGDKHGKASGGGSGGGNWATKLLRNPVAWAVAGVGALLVAVFASGVPMPTVGTAPSSDDARRSRTAICSTPSSPGARRSAPGRRYSARTCDSMVQRARADYGRDWESELSRKVRADCGRAIQEARRDDRRLPQQAEGPRGRGPGAGDVEVQRLNVAYGDLDLTTSAGAERFLATVAERGHSRLRRPARHSRPRGAARVQGLRRSQYGQRRRADPRAAGDRAAPAGGIGAQRRRRV